MLSIQSMEWSTYYLLLTTASAWATEVAIWEPYNCVNPELPSPVTEPEAPAPQSAGPCPPELKKKTAVGSFGPASIKLNCEELTIGIAPDVLPLLQAFGEVSINAREDRITFVVGAQAEGKLGVVKGGFKSGLYIKSDLNGELVDAGWRIGPSATAGAGPVEYEVMKDEMDLSFIPDTTPQP
jgi:hypothetical protein